MDWIIHRRKKKKKSTKLLLNFWYSEFQAEKLTIVSQSEVQKSVELHRGRDATRSSFSFRVDRYSFKVTKSFELNSLLY